MGIKSTNELESYYDFFANSGNTHVPKAPTYVDQLFQTNVWIGDLSAMKITNGLDNSSQGGMLWHKTRASGYHDIIDTVGGKTKILYPNANNDYDTDAGGFITSFDTDGYTLINAGSGNYFVGSGTEHVGWNFRKGEKFFDIVSYTGDGTSGREISHSLGSIPGCVIVKCTNQDESWAVYHRAIRDDGGTAGAWSININSTNAGGANSGVWNDTNPTSTVFTVGNDGQTNQDTYTYIAYIFAHEEEAFGVDKAQKVISCGSYTGNGGTNGPEIDLGWEPQFLLIKRVTTNGGQWAMFDNIRGVHTKGQVTGAAADNTLFADNIDAESNYEYLQFNSTGFQLKSTSGDVNDNTKHYIYIAVRRPDGYVGKPADAGTDVFAMDVGNSSSTIPTFDSNFVVDMAFKKKPTDAGAPDWWIGSRLQGQAEMKMNADTAEGANASFTWDSNVGWEKGGDGTDRQSWMFKRGAGFDVLCWDGNSSNRTISHGMNVAPEMIWFKQRGTYAQNWPVYHSGLNGGSNAGLHYVYLDVNLAENDSTSMFNSTAPTSSVISLGTNGNVNQSGYTYVAYLFASVSGISKCGNYTGTGSSGLSIDCGFQPRFVTVKRSDSTSNWNTVDSLRGMSSGSAPVLYLNDTDTEQSLDWINGTSTGFDLVTTNVNVNADGGEYIYYAHA
tara:strand:- start:4247 stop:6256 length:2010 start_codon:yes stop_codon:yes gene_type:complete